MSQTKSSSREVIKETWLSRKPHPSASIVAAMATFLLALGSLFYMQNVGHLAAWMPASHQLVFDQHQIWRLWTTLFAHADEKHLLSNSFLFFILGYFLNGYFQIFVFPIMALFIGGLANLIVLWTMPAQVHLIGASGVVFWMGGAWLTLYFLLDRRRNLYQRLLRTLGVAILLFVPAEAFDPNISYRTHFVGFILGLVFGLIYYYLKRRQFVGAEVRELVIDDELTP